MTVVTYFLLEYSRKRLAHRAPEHQSTRALSARFLASLLIAVWDGVHSSSHVRAGDENVFENSFSYVALLSSESVGCVLVAM